MKRARKGVAAPDYNADRPDGLREVQPPFLPGRRPSAVFRPLTAAQRPPADGVWPLPEVPAAPGFWVIKPAGLPLELRYFSQPEIRTARALDADKLSFYPFTPAQHPDRHEIARMHACVDQYIAALAAEEEHDHD